MTITRTRFIAAACLLVGALCFLAYFEYTKYVDAKLVRIIKNELSEFNLPTDGTIVYQKIESNHNCSWSDVTVVYSSNKTPKDSCASVLSSIPLQKWQPQHDLQQTDFCEEDKTSTKLIAQNLSKTTYFSSEAYPQAAANGPIFMPVNPVAELDIQQKAKEKHWKSFYYIHLTYQTPNDREHYACGEMQTYCACSNPTYFEETIFKQENHTAKSSKP